MDGSLADLSKYRFERAMEEMDNAKAMYESGRYKLALNRSYYAIFHAMRTVNVLDGFDSSKHSGVIAYFNRYNVKSGDFPRDTSKIIRSASEMREHADYEDFFVVFVRDVEEQIIGAESFITYVSKYLKNKGI